MSAECCIGLIALMGVLAFIVFFLFIMYLVKRVFKDYALQVKALRPIAFIFFAYLAMCLLFGGIYSFIRLADKTAFAGTGVSENFVWDSIYLSFITILTIGYGDIAPVNWVARSFVIIEGCIGLLFISVLVAVVLNQAPEVLKKSSTAD